jgi:hypothetical protein
MLELILKDPWISGFIVLVTQFLFVMFRTLNVIHTSERNILKAVITGNVIGILWLLSIAIGADAVMSMTWQPILAYLIGGTIGTFVGFILKK